MSDPVLHIKDSYYFDVPKMLAPAAYTQRADFPEAWGQNDPQFQDWEFERMYPILKDICSLTPDKSLVKSQWKHWRDGDLANFSKSFDIYLAEGRQEQLAAFSQWKQGRLTAARQDKETSASDLKSIERLTINDFLDGDAAVAKIPVADMAWFTKCMDDSVHASKWEATFAKHDFWQEYCEDEGAAKWSQDKIQAYNGHLSGKVLIPQVFGAKLRNLYEPDYSHGYAPAISKFMVIGFLVALILIAAFSWVAKKVGGASVPRGPIWNMLEVFLVFLRDTVARPAIGMQHDDHHEGHAHGHDDVYPELAPGEPATVMAAHARHPKDPHIPHNPYALADSYVPILWTIFLFILGCNLFGMLPWMGSPTGAWSVTLSLAMTTLVTVIFAGICEFGPIGFLGNLVPTMDIKGPLGWIIKSMIFLIEVVGLLIKHLVLSIRLLANMVAGHLVLLGIMGISFSAASAVFFTHPETHPLLYWVSAFCSVAGSTVLSVLELGVAFLQAYVFTLLSALFIGSAVHKH